MWLDGEQVSMYAGRRRHRLPNQRVPVDLTTGWHQVLVRAAQRRGDFDFSVKVCAVETDKRYDGNTPSGLTWRVPNPSDDPGTESASSATIDNAASSGSRLTKFISPSLAGCR